ncbi:MAG: helix-turn-helix domain-containing protein [Thermoplasmata archaeon]|nr:helix-turn-helix domain-containing protein [Thermoplasmata archaeon]
MDMAPGVLARAMGIWEVSLRASYDYPFIDLSRQFPETPISMWCIWDRELLQVPTKDPQVIRGVERALRRTGHVIDEWVDSRASRVFLLDCTCSRYDSLWNVIEAHQCWDAPPVIYLDGWANFRVLSFTANRPRELYAELKKRGPAELTRKREISLSVLPTSVWTNSLFGDMTGKQMDALLAAHRFGYYTSPRPVTTDDISSSVGISRTTYEEHLRKAENKVMAALMPYLQLYASSERPAERLPLRQTLVGPQGSGPGTATTS